MLTNSEETRIKACFLNCSDTVIEAKMLWAREWHCDVNSFIFVVGTVTLKDDTIFKNIPFSSPGIIELIVEEKISLFVKLFGSNEEDRNSKFLSVALSSLAQDLYDSARKLYGLSNDRAIRFRCGTTVVAGEQSLRAAGVMVSSGIVLELGWHVILRRVGCTDKEITLFHSKLLEKISSSRFRLRSGTSTKYLDNINDMASNIITAELLLQNDINGFRTDQLVLEAVCEMAILQDNTVRTLRIWPQDGVVSDSRRRELLLMGRVMPCGSGFFPALPLHPSHVLLHDSLRLVGVFPEGKRAVLRVPRNSSVLDLLKVASTFRETHERLQVMLSGRTLREDASLCTLDLQEKQEINLQRVSTKICAQFGSCELTWKLPENREEVTFGEIVAGISSGLSEQRKILLNGLLKCDGCGRKLSRERQGFQQVPSACCEVRSMHLCYAAKGQRGENTVTRTSLCHIGHLLHFVGTERPNFFNI